MAEIVPGFTTEQRVAVVAANESDINDAIDLMAADNWIVISFTPSGTDVIILYTRTIPLS